jgi:misacylated tRNA(Ala) deacylase
VALVVEERKRAEKRSQDLEEELAKFIVSGLQSEIVKAEGLLFKKHLHRTDDSSATLTFLSTISTIFSTSAAQDKPYLIILSSSPSSQTSTSSSIVLVFGSDENLVKKAGECLKSSVGIKGGGKGLKWSGKFAGVWKTMKEGALIETLLKEL